MQLHVGVPNAQHLLKIMVREIRGAKINPKSSFKN
jgi:hypothetical protein